MNTSTVLALLGTVLGLYYAYLGIAAGAYFVDEAKRRSVAERVFVNPGWSIGPGDEYTQEGQKLCRKETWLPLPQSCAGSLGGYSNESEV